jgi:hypothetical protein
MASGKSSCVRECETARRRERPGCRIIIVSKRLWIGVEGTGGVAEVRRYIGRRWAVPGCTDGLDVDSKRDTRLSLVRRPDPTKLVQDGGEEAEKRFQPF